MLLLAGLVLDLLMVGVVIFPAVCDGFTHKRHVSKVWSRFFAPSLISEVDLARLQIKPSVGTCGRQTSCWPD